MCSSICPFQALDLQINGESIKEIAGYPHIIKSADIDDDECINCKACETACPQDAITITRELPSRAELITGEIDIDKDTCISCGMCEEMCPVDAIELDHQMPTSDNPVVATDINVDTDKCVHCGICKRICPVDAITQVCRICPYGEYEIAEPEITGTSYIDPELCVNCTWCQEICPVDAAKVTKPFEGELTIDSETCQGCETCVMVCPCNVLSFPKSTKAGVNAEKLHKDERFCIYCGACGKSCPVNAIDVKRTKINYTPTKSKAWKKAFESLEN
jgi:4Fe-4S ferredoxin